MIKLNLLKSAFVFFVLTLPLASNGQNIVRETKIESPNTSAQKQIQLVLTSVAEKDFSRIKDQSSFLETIGALHLVVKSSERELRAVYSHWIAEQVEGLPKDQKLFSRTHALEIGATVTLTVNSPEHGFLPGKYRIEVDLGDGDKRSLPFEIEKVFDPATRGLPVGHAPGFNIAYSGFGGHLLQVTSEYDADRWAARNLIDGAPFKTVWRTDRDCESCGWSSKPLVKLPQEIVLAFNQERSALIDTVVLDTRTFETITKVNGIPKHVEVWVSEYKDREFKKIAEARIHNEARVQSLQFSPVITRFVKLRLLSQHSGSVLQLGEIQVIEADSKTQSILKDIELNLALPEVGGHLVDFSSQHEQNRALELFDTKVGLNSGWVSAKNFRGNAGYLPQEFILAFKQGELAFVERLAISLASGRNGSKADPRSWARKVAIYVSTQRPGDGYEDLGVFDLHSHEQEQTILVQRKVRYLKIRVLENHGADHTSIGEIRVVEGRPKDYVSILTEFYPHASDDGKNTGEALNKLKSKYPGATLEIEPNNSVQQATQSLSLDLLRGEINPLAERDFYKLQVGDTAPSSALTFHLESWPFISTSVTLLNAKEVAVKQFDPSMRSLQQTRFTWIAKPGDYFVQLKSEPASVVLVWDTSGSMVGRTAHSIAAINHFIDQIRADDKVNLIRFSNSQTEVLLTEFTGDKEKLRAAIKGKVFAEGGTPLFDAVKKATELLSTRKGNRAIVLLSDGGDSESLSSQSQVFELLRAAHIRVYAIGLGLDLDRFLPEFVSNGKWMLQYLALMSGGRLFESPESADLKNIFQRIGADIRQPPTYFLRTDVVSATGSLELVATGEPIPAVTAPAKIALILDASGSMKRKINGRRMIDSAKQVIGELLSVIPTDVELGLRVFGHRIVEGRPGDCQDAELKVRYAKNNASNIQAKLKTLQALGTTPIAYTLSQLLEDTQPVSAYKLAVLITDGKEECRGDPLAAIQKLRAQDPRFRLNIVGFALTDKKDREIMRALATAGNGQFYLAQDAAALKKAIRRALMVGYEVHDDAGEVVVSGALGEDKVYLPSGVFHLKVFTHNEGTAIRNVEIGKGKHTRVELKKEGQEIGIKVLAPAE